MKSKAFVVTWFVTATILCSVSVSLLFGAPNGAAPATTSPPVQQTTSGARTLQSSSVSDAAPDTPSWPEPLLYLLVGVTLIGIAVAAKQVIRIRGKALRMRKLSEISELEFLSLTTADHTESFEERAGTTIAR